MPATRCPLRVAKAMAARRQRSGSTEALAPRSAMIPPIARCDVASFWNTAPGYQRLVTHTFVGDDPWLSTDAVFGVKAP